MRKTDKEKKLIDALKKRPKSREASALINKYYDEIYIFAYKQTFNKENALDLTQEIFINAITNISRYDSGKASFRTWLYKIASNKIIDYHRKNSLPNFHLDINEVEIEDGHNFIDSIENEEILHRAEEIISRFPQKTQEILRMKLYGGMTFSEIGAAISQNEASVKTLYYRCVKNIKKELSDEY